MQRTHRLALYVGLTTLMLAGCDLGVGHSLPSSYPTVPSVLVSSVMENPGGIAAGYGKLTLTALNPSNSTVRWRYQTDWHPYQGVGKPLEADGIVYTVSDPIPRVCSNPVGNLVALRESDGHQLWSVSVGVLPSPPVVASGVVYTSALNFDECATPPSHREIRSYYALRASDGHQLWRTDLTHDTTDANPADTIGFDSSLHLVDGTLVATTEDLLSDVGDRVGHLFAFDAASGKLRWKNTFFSDISIHTGPIANGVLYVMASPRDEPLEWTAYRASDGQPVLQLSGAYVGRFLVTGGVIFADVAHVSATSTPQHHSVDSQVVALDAHTGQQLWQVTADTNDNGINALLGVRNNTVYVQTGPSTYTQKAAGHWRLEGVDSQSGHVRWSAPLQWLLGSLVVADAAVYGYSDEMLPGQVMARDAGDGHMLWSTPIDAAQNGRAVGRPRSLVLGNGTLYAAVDTGSLTAIRAQDGATLWTAQIEGSGTTQIEGGEVGMTVVG